MHESALPPELSAQRVNHCLHVNGQTPCKAGGAFITPKAAHSGAVETSTHPFKVEVLEDTCRISFLTKGLSTVGITA